MEGLILSTKEQNRLQILNGVMERDWSMGEAAQLMGVSERHGWRLLAGYQKEGEARLVHRKMLRREPPGGVGDIAELKDLMAADRRPC